MLTLLFASPAFSSDEARRLWGPTDRFNELLLASPQLDRNVDRAFRMMERNDQSGAELLLEVFGHDFDEFQPIGESATGIRNAALKRLGQADLSVQRIWLKSVEPVAEAALKEVEPSTAALLKFARRFPMTSAASQAFRLAAAIEDSRGITDRAVRLRKEADQQIRGQFETYLESTRPIVAGYFPQTSGELNFPQPDPIWKWHERTSGLPSGTASAVENPERFQNLIRRNSWVAGILDQTVVVRTPLRFVGLDLNDGREQWSLKTESLPDQFHAPLQTMLGPQLISADWMNTCVAAWWTLSDRRLFFVDGQTEAEFRTGFERNRLPNSNNFGVPLRRNYVMGSRLVAAQVSDSARVLWQLGGRDKNRPEFENHLFCGPPACGDGELFVISTQEKSTPQERVFFLNCLDDSTGKLNWRCPLSIGQLRGLVSHQEFAVCCVQGDIVTCVLNDSIFVSVHRLDGRLLNATTFFASNATGRFDAASDVGRASPGRPPVASAGKVVHVQRSGLSTVCIDSLTGQPCWTVNRVIGEGGLLEGSRDLFPVGITSAGVVIAGSRHLRMLDLQDGKQKWIVQVDGIAGQPALTNSTCIVSTPSSKLLQIEIATGQIRHVPFEYSAGSVASSSDRTLIVTADSVVAYRNQNNSDRPSATQQLLAGQPGEARRILEDSATLSSEDAEILVRLTSPSAPIPPQAIPHAKARRLAVASGLTVDQTSLTPEDLNAMIAFSNGREAKLKRLVAAEKNLRAPVTEAVVPPTRRQRAAEWIVEPSQATVEEILALANTLEQSNQRSAADLLLTSAMVAHPTESLQLKSRRTELRTDWVVPEADIPPGSLKLADDDSVKEILKLETADEAWNILNNMDVAVQTPDWYRCQLLKEGRVLYCFDQQLGVLTGRLRLPEQCQFGPIRRNSELPAVIPFVSVDGANRVMFGMIGLLHHASPVILWHRPMPFRKDDSGYCRLAGYSARYLMVQSRSYIYCLNPLTGELMWSRPFSTWDCSPDNKGLNRTYPFGDAAVAGFFGPLQRHATIFRPSDGKRLLQASLEDQGSRALISGKTAVYLKRTDDGPWQLHLRHLDDRQQKEFLNDDKILLASGGNVELLTDSRALCLDQQQRLVLIDLQQGRVLWRTNLAANLQQKTRYTIDAFKVGPHLIVNLRYSNRRSFYGESGSRWHERRLMPGLVACVDQNDGRLNWITQQKEAAVLQPIFGDSAPFLVSWTRTVPAMNGLFERRLGANMQDYSLQLQCRDLTTGDIVARVANLHTDEPYHCLFSAETREAVIKSRRSTVRLRFEP